MDLDNKIDELFELLKATKKTLVPMPKSPIPSVPPIKPVKPPSMVPSQTAAAKLPGLAPDAKKNPKKIAQQIKDGSMSTKTQKVMFKNETISFAKNGQWSLQDISE